MYVMGYMYQSGQERIVTWSDSDFAGCIKSSRSTSGGIVMHRGHPVKSWSMNQTVIALSSGESVSVW